MLARHLAMIVPISLLPACAYSGPGGPAVRVDRTVTARPGAEIRVTNVAGRVRFLEGAEGHVRVTGRLGAGTDHLELETREDRVDVRVVLPENARNVEGSELDVLVPPGARIAAHVVSADVEVAQVGRQIAIESVSGDVDIRAARPLERMDLATVSGRVHMAGLLRGRGPFDVRTVSGDVELSPGAEAGRGAPIQIAVQTLSGRVRSAFPLLASHGCGFGPGCSRRFGRGEGGPTVDIATMSGDVELALRHGLN